MEHEEPSSNSAMSWLNQLTVGGGVPQVILGPAGKAISRLVAGVTDIPAAWLESKAQKIKDDTAARSTISGAVASAASNQAALDPMIVDRSLHRWLGEQYRRQENREAVARKTVEILEEMLEEAPETEYSSPNDDWMNIFERHAENASSDEFRILWSRVLAGEIRNKGAFSLSTLQFISVLDKETADLINKILPFCIENFIIPIDASKDELLIGEFITLEEAGFLTTANSQLSIQRTPDENGYVFFGMGKYNLVVETTQKIFVLNSYKLTKCGTQLAKIIPTNYEKEKIAESLIKSGPEKVHIGHITIDQNGDQIVKITKTITKKIDP
ncbi:DUF2806 domain-containing protein [Mesorhizobium sp. KR2-14]|uniref:DUF2806 domain-containing protein n=1 Tax=Mesorhizobium sp. KR2-14 TaxID=3156610 RepID=UPI0032B31447